MDNHEDKMQEGEVKLEKGESEVYKGAEEENGEVSRRKKGRVETPPK